MLELDGVIIYSLMLKAIIFTNASTQKNAIDFQGPIKRFPLFDASPILIDRWRPKK